MSLVGCSSDEKTLEGKNVFSVSRHVRASGPPRIGLYTFLAGSIEWLFKERGFAVRHAPFFVWVCSSFVVVAW